MTGRRTAFLLTILVASLFAATAAGAHPGPTDSRGCHFSEKEGYHCHK